MSTDIVIPGCWPAQKDTATPRITDKPVKKSKKVKPTDKHRKRIKRRKGAPTVTQLLAIEKRGKKVPFYKLKEDVLKSCDELTAHLRLIQAQFFALKKYWDDNHIEPLEYENTTWTQVTEFVSQHIPRIADAKQVISLIDKNKTNPFDALQALGKVSDTINTVSGKLMSVSDRMDELMTTYGKPMREYILSLNDTKSGIADTAVYTPEPEDDDRAPEGDSLKTNGDHEPCDDGEVTPSESNDRPSTEAGNG